MKRFVIGIDYSITSPGICIYDTKKELHPDNCYYLAFVPHPKKFPTVATNITLVEYPKEFKTQTDRFAQIANKTLAWIYRMTSCDVTDIVIGIEGYAMGARGKVFNMAENVGTLKFLLHQHQLHVIDDIPPKTIKKEMIGNGNASKQDVYDSFIKDGGTNLHTLLTPNKKVESSFVMDIVDSYYVMKYVFEKQQ